MCFTQNSLFVLVIMLFLNPGLLSFNFHHDNRGIQIKNYTF